MSDLATSGIRDNIEFVSGGLTIRGWLYPPQNRTARGTGAIVMSHGFAFVKEFFDAHDYPARFASAGFAVLVFDHPNTGESEGEPRQELDPIAQQRAYRDAITFVSEQPGVDDEYIGIWGTSYSGGHVLAVAATDCRVRCVVSQVMTISGHDNLRDRYTPSELSELRRGWAEDRRRRAQGEAPAMTRAGSDETAEFIGRLPAETRRRYQNAVTVRSLEFYDGYEPAAFIERISPAPLLMIVCNEDERTPAKPALEAYASALEPKRLVLLPGGHFSVYEEHFDESSALAASWFREHLLVGRT